MKPKRQSQAKDQFGEAIKTMFAPLAPTAPKSSTNSQIQTYAFALSPNARAELSLKGTITTDDLELLRDHIELTIKALTRSVKSEALDTSMAVLRVAALKRSASP